MNIFGGNTGVSYDELQSRRQMVDRLRQQNATNAPRNVGEGIHAIARALVARGTDRQNREVEGRLKSEADQMWQSVFGGTDSAPASYGSAAATSSYGGVNTPQVSTMPEGEAIADDTMEMLIKTGLVERGLPQHVAEGFAINAKDESGLRTDINEIAPLVPGSRGGFGLMQWTGPRRVALEEEAARRGVNPSDFGLQLDTIVSELQGPEASAARSILSTSDAGAAATAIVNDFLRPAPQHRASRAARYGGQAAGTPSAGVFAGQSGPSIEQIAAALSNPMIQRDPGRVAVLQALLGQKMQSMDPMQAIEMERAQLELEQLRNPTPDMTTGQREYEMARAQGYQGTFMDYKRDLAEAQRSQTNVSVNSGSEVGTIPQGYELFTSPETGARSLRPIPGGPEDTTQTDEAKRGAALASSAVVVRTAERALEAARDRSIGGLAGQFAARVNPANENAELYRQTEALKSIASAEALNAMRRQSPTGGALGNVTEKELKLLSEQAGALDPASPNYERDLQDYTLTLLQTIHGFDDGTAIFRETMGGAFSRPVQADDGWTVEAIE